MPTLLHRRHFPLAAILLLAALTRLVYLLCTWHVYGDAVQYADIAQRIAHGQPITEGLRSWMQGFCLYQAPFHLVFSDKIAAATVASIIPGILLVAPIFYLANLLYGRTTAVLAGAIAAVHPYLVHYSTGGYFETLYLLCFSTGIAALTGYILRPRWTSAALFGTAFGLALTVRNEVAPVFVAGLFIPALVLILNRIRKDNRSPAPLLPAALRIILAALCFATVVTAFGFTSHKLTGTTGLFTKTENFSRVYDLHTEPADAARELLGPDGHNQTPGETRLTPSLVLKALAARAPKNFAPLVKSTAKLLANPIYLLALIPLVLWWKRGRHIAPAQLPTLLMLAFPPCFYTLFFVESRYLLASLIPLTIYASAGLATILTSLESVSKLPRIFILGALSFCLVLFLAADIYRGRSARQEAHFHQAAAEAFEKNIPSHQLVIGCGIGFVTDTTFRSGHRFERRLVTDDPADLATFAKKHHTPWLVIYRGFLTRHNPALIPAFNSTIPGFELVAEVKTSPDHHLKIYRLRSAH